MICEVCGNEIQAGIQFCPFCDSPQKQIVVPAKTNVAKVGSILLKEGNPTTAQAMELLHSGLANARKSGTHVVRLIHGYGSSGVGGAIKTATLKRLEVLKRNGEIRSYLTGEDHFKFGASRNVLLKKYPVLKETWISDRGNPGITFVEL